MTVDGTKFGHFLDNLEAIVGDVQVTVLMDNAPVHRAAKMSGNCEIRKMTFPPSKLKSEGAV